MHLRRYLVAGLLIWLPVGATILIFKFLLDLVDRVLFLIPYAYRPETLLGFRIPGLGAILALLILLATGMLAANLVGRRLVVLYESWLNRIPIVRTVYGGVKKFAAVVFSDSGTSFKKVLLVEYPRRGVYRIGFQTSENAREIQAVDEPVDRHGVRADDAERGLRIHGVRAARGRHRAHDVGGRGAEDDHLARRRRSRVAPGAPERGACAL